jgi:hypothetical protein
VRKSEGSASERSHRFGFAEMLRDVFVVPIGRGEVLVTTASLVVVLIVLKLPGDLISALLMRLLDSLERGCIWGYLAAVVLGVPWVLRWLRRRQSPRSQKRN